MSPKLHREVVEPEHRYASSARGGGLMSEHPVVAVHFQKYSSPIQVTINQCVGKVTRKKIDTEYCKQAVGNGKIITVFREMN